LLRLWLSGSAPPTGLRLLRGGIPSILLSLWLWLNRAIPTGGLLRGGGSAPSSLLLLCRGCAPSSLLLLRCIGIPSALLRGRTPTCGLLTPTLLAGYLSAACLLSLPVRWSSRGGSAGFLLAAVAEKKQGYNQNNKRNNQDCRCDNKRIVQECW